MDMSRQDEIRGYLAAAVNATSAFNSYGKVATYIPELANADPEAFSLSYYGLNSDLYNLGDGETTFTIQSVSKVITLAMALELYGSERVFEYVGVENNGLVFNDINCIGERAVNPMVNAGAITVTGLLYGQYGSKTVEQVISMLHTLTGMKQLGVDERVFKSEMSTATKNRALSYYLTHMELLEGDTEAILEAYIRQCAILVNTDILAAVGAVLANRGINTSGEKVLSDRTVASVMAIMSSCGMYNTSGEFMMEVGMPSKSGVSGCIMSAVPGKCGLAVYSPGLDDAGNSYRGIKVLKNLSKNMGLNIYL